MNSPLVSIIIPAYNAGANIAQCIESIDRQNAISFEAIVVNDGSSDETASTLKLLSETRSWLHVITQQNSGVAAARNNGMMRARGRFLTFLDADDMLAPDALEALVSDISENNACIAYGSYELFGDRTLPLRTVEFPASWYGTTRSGRDVLRLLLSFAAQTPSGSACRVIYDTAYLKNIGARFPEGVSMSEDYCFILDALANASSVAITDKVVYRYRQHPESTTSNFIPTMRSDMEFVNSKILKICGRDESLLHLYRDCVANTCLLVAQNELRSGISSKQIRFCAKLFGSEVYRNQLLSLRSDSTLGVPKAMFMRMAGVMPIAATVVLAASQGLEKLRRKTSAGRISRDAQPTTASKERNR